MSSLGLPLSRPDVRPSASAPQAAAPLLLFAVAGIALVSGFLIFALSASVPADTITVGSSLRETATFLDGHAAAMIDDGQRLMGAAQASTGPDRDHWTADGAQMVVEGRTLLALGQRLRVSATLLGEQPTERARADLALIENEALLLRADGQAAVGHGQAMVAHSKLMVTLAARPGSGITPADAAPMEQDASRIVDAGARISQTADALVVAVDRLRRSLGLSP